MESDDNYRFMRRFAQKSTIGVKMHQYDIPFSNGQPPNMIINPQCIPNRMTIAKLIEICDKRVQRPVQATTFNSFDLESFRQDLIILGFKDDNPTEVD